MERFQLEQRYTRSDPRGLFPRLSGMPPLEHNRLGVFWRPIIDMTDSPVAPLRLRMIQPVSEWLADPRPDRWSWFAMIGVAGLRHQVLRHAGLDHYDCRRPTELPEELRTPQWNVLMRAIDRFPELDPAPRALVVFQLAQLSYCQYALELAGPVAPTGDPGHDRYVYEVARVHARYPGHGPKALALFRELAAAKDPLLALASCAQGIGHSIRGGDRTGLAGTFAGLGERVLGSVPRDDWHAWLVRSRFHRAVALLRLAEGRPDAMRDELETALRWNERLTAGAAADADRMAAVENTRYLLEARILLAARGRHRDEARKLCEDLNRLDPHCVEARLAIGDAHVSIGDHREAARWYARAGELGTGSGAVGWFRAAQCHEFIGERGAALNAMGRCVELDATAVEPKAYLERRTQTGSAGHAGGAGRAHPAEGGTMAGIPIEPERDPAGQMLEASGGTSPGRGGADAVPSAAPGQARSRV
ncbi:tetratricopeptide repeat protein [Planomonospora algeriensis]